MVIRSILLMVVALPWAKVRHSISGLVPPKKLANWALTGNDVFTPPPLF